MGAQVLTIVGGVVGGVVGTFAGGNTVLGAELGAAVGGVAGSLLYPQKIDGPRTRSVMAQNGAYGTMLAFGYGNFRTAPTLIWQIPIQEVSSQSGKGGPSVTTYSYLGWFAVAVCEGPIVGIRRIWANGVLIYDVSSAATAQTLIASNQLATNYLTIYPGNYTQMPDPTIQAYVGVGLTPAYRGTAYIIFRGLPLVDFGNVLPSINVEVISVGAGAVVGKLWENDAIGGPTPYMTNTPAAGLYAPFISSISAGIRVINRATSVTGGPATTRSVTVLNSSTGLLSYDDTDSGNLLEQGWPYYSPYLAFTLFGNSVPVTRILAVDPTGSFFISYATPLGFYVFTGTTSGFNAVCIASVSTSVGATIDDVVARLTPGGSGWSLVGIMPCANRNYFLVLTQDSVNAYAHVCSLNSLTGITQEVTRYTFPVALFVVNPFSYPQLGPLSTDINLCCGYLESDLTHFWISQLDVAGGGVGSLLYYFQLSTGALTTVYTIPVAWTDATQPKQYISMYADNGVCFLVSGNMAVAWSASQSISTVTLASIVSDICQRSGIAAGSLDTSALTDGVWGYVIDRQMTARAALEALVSAFWFDAVESDTKLKFVHRSAAPVATITLDDMGADIGGKVSTSPLSFIRGSEIELPTQINLTYYAVGGSYQQGVQYARRVSTSQQNNIVAIDTAAVMDDTQAAVSAAINLWDRIAGRTPFKFSTGYRLSTGSVPAAQLEPTDIVNMQTVNETYLARLGRKVEAAGKIDWEAIACAPVYSQAAAGGAITAGQSVSGPLQTNAVIMDIAPLRDADGALPNLYVALWGYTGWPGGTLFKSSDGGGTWVPGLSQTTLSTIGSATSALGNFFGGNTFDEANTVSVQLSNASTLSSVSALSVLNGSNAALLGNEILQFKNAVLVGTGRYTLSGLLRGRFGTEWAMAGHGIGDRFVLLTGVIQVQPTPSSDIGQPRLYQAVTALQAVGSGQVQTITEAGNTLVCFSPVLLNATNNGVAGGNVALNWVRRNRITWQWLPLVDVPMSEASEAYVVSIFSGSSVVRTINVSGTGVQNATYTTAQQTTDFGAPLALNASLTFGVQQVSAVTGPGVMAKVTMPLSSATVPGAPTIGTATGGNAQASITFTAPAFNGGSAITSYTATSSPGGFTASGASSPLVVTGLTNGTAYTFTVTATNIIGTGAPSAASNSVTPVGATGTVVQSVKIIENMSGSSGGTQTGSLTGVTAGNTIVVFLANYSTAATAACSDGQGSYTADVDTGSNLIRSQSFHLANANAGTHSIAVTNTGTYYAVWAVEITAPTSSPYDIGAGQYQSAPGGGTDACTSGSFTTTQTNDLILGFIGVNGQTPAVGTGFTDRGLSTGSAAVETRVESKLFATAGATAATYTTSGASCATIGLAFKHP